MIDVFESVEIGRKVVRNAATRYAEDHHMDVADVIRQWSDFVWLWDVQPAQKGLAIEYGAMLGELAAAINTDFDDASKLAFVAVRMEDKYE